MFVISTTRADIMAKLDTRGRNSPSACQYFKSPRRILVLGKILQDQGPITAITVTPSAGVTASLVIMQFFGPGAVKWALQSIDDGLSRL